MARLEKHFRLRKRAPVRFTQVQSVLNEKQRQSVACHLTARSTVPQKYKLVLFPFFVDPTYDPSANQTKIQIFILFVMEKPLAYAKQK